VQRSAAARRQFQREHPCPSTGKTTGACPGWVVDHVFPLKRGGVDAPANMQWQTVADAKAKDRVE
jgi:5-methylcytosine-specific restriction endonuclease McrA